MMMSKLHKVKCAELELRTNIKMAGVTDSTLPSEGRRAVEIRTIKTIRLVYQEHTTH